MALEMKNGENSTIGKVVRLGDAIAIKVSFAVEVPGYPDIKYSHLKTGSHLGIIINN